MSWWEENVASPVKEAVSAPGKAVDKVNPWLKADQANRQKGRDEYAQNQAAKAAQMAANPKYDTADANHYLQMSQLTDQYKTAQSGYLDQYVGDKNSGITQLLSQSQKQAQDAQATYTNNVLPQLQEIQAKHKVNANSAMTLEEAMDPNNKLATEIRELYDRLGQQERMRGQQDFGVLSALGAQAAGGQFGVMPMTSGRMGQIYAANQTQAGDAYARAQQRMYDLQQQGIERGFDDTKHWYDKGQESIDKYGQSTKDIQTAYGNHAATMGGYRDEQAGYMGNIYDAQSQYQQGATALDMGMAHLGKQNTYASTDRELAAQMAALGRERDRSDSQYERDMGKYNANADLMKTIITGQAQASGASQGSAGAADPGMMAMLASMFAASDKRVKSQIGDIKRSQLKEFFGAIKPKKYKYKNPNTAITRPGQRYGFMLQDVAKTKLGKAITHKMPDGTLAYDKDNLQGILVAALADNYRGKLKSGRKRGH